MVAYCKYILQGINFQNERHLANPEISITFTLFLHYKALSGDQSKIDIRLFALIMTEYKGSWGDFENWTPNLETKSLGHAAPYRSNLFYIHAVFGNNFNFKKKFCPRLKGWRPFWEIPDPLGILYDFSNKWHIWNKCTTSYYVCLIMSIDGSKGGVEDAPPSRSNLFHFHAVFHKYLPLLMRQPSVKVFHLVCVNNILQNKAKIYNFQCHSVSNIAHPWYLREPPLNEPLDVWPPWGTHTQHTDRVDKSLHSTSR